MMDREWQAILSRYGQSVTVDAQGVRAFLQPILERGRDQKRPSPLGVRREDRFLYLGPRQVPLEAGVSRVVWEERDYVVCSAQLVGDSHWWAVLRPGDEVEV